MIPCLFLHRRQNMADVTEFTKNSNPMEIVINDGSERVPIKNLSGEEIGVFYFRPTDSGIIDRYNKIAKEFGGITEPLDRAEIGPDGTPRPDCDVRAWRTRHTYNMAGVVEQLHFQHGNRDQRDSKTLVWKDKGTKGPCRSRTPS